MRKVLLLLGLLSLIGCSQNLYLEGQQLADKGEYDRAIELYYDQIKADPKNAAAWREIGVAYYKKGDMAKAEEGLKQAIAINADARSNLYLGLVYEKQEKLSPAIDAYRAAMSLKPEGGIRRAVQAHLDLLISKRVRSDAALAIHNEAKVKADTIPENSIAVIDFNNSNLPEDLAPLSKGLAEFTAIDLAKIHSLKVVDRAKIDLILKELQIASSEYADPKFAPRMGRLIGGRRIVTGSIVGLENDQIRLDGAVVDAADKTTKTTSPTEGQLNHFFKIQKEFVFKVIDDLGITLTPEERDSIQKIPTESYLAFLAYCRGLDYRSRGMLDQARAEFRASASADKNFEQAEIGFRATPSQPSTAESGGGELAARFEEQVTTISDNLLSGSNLGMFQEGAILDNGFIRDFRNLINFGTLPWTPPRTSDLTGTIIIRGTFDVSPTSNTAP